MTSRTIHNLSTELSNWLLYTEQRSDLSIQDNSKVEYAYSKPRLRQIMRFNLSTFEHDSTKFLRKNYLKQQQETNNRIRTYMKNYIKKTPFLNYKAGRF